MKRIAVLTSGGDAPGMNAAIRAVVRSAIFNGLEVYGVERGYRGLIEGNLFEMKVSSVGDIIHRGGTILKSARCPEFATEEGRTKALNVLKVFKIDGLVVIGGDGTFRGAQALSKLDFPTIGIPGTIDNDLAYTDFTIGFDTAVNTAIDAISKLRDTSSSHERISLVQVMGRNCGDIALYAGLTGGAEAALVPEMPFEIENISRKIIEGAKRGKTQSIVVIAEGVGHIDNISKQIIELTGLEARSTILGHIQRGGSPSAADRILASTFGAKAVELLLDGKSSRVIGVNGNEIMDMDIDEALKMPSKFNKDMYKLIDVLAI